jgi:hypothetical protein
MPERAPVSANKLTLIGMLWVNVPVIAIFALGAAGFIWLFPVSAHSPPNAAVGAAPVVGPIWLLGTFVLAWLWWSVTVVKWRLWALARTDNWQRLEAKAIEDGLIWNQNTLCGRLFGRTEIWSRKDREREADLKRQQAHRAAGAHPV